MNSYKKVVITGATGLIGKEAIKPLKEAGFDVYALTIDKIEASSNADNVHFIPCNLFDDNAVKKVFDEIKPSHLLNFAWATTDDYLTSNINFDFLRAGLNLLKYFAAYGGKRAVFPGTCFEYAFKDTPLKEMDEVLPQTTYAKCKNHLRQLSEIFCRQNGISFGWGRIFYVYGHNENTKRLTAHIINSIKNNKEVTINSGSLVKDYIYSKDIAQAFVKFLDGDTQGIVNICTGQGITLGEYALTIAKKLGRADLIKIFNEPTTQPTVIIGDNSRLLTEVGYKIQYLLDQALDNILNG
ncbi:MAG: NAD(P)-dependent oxidoreductase [Endomicrobium sp.]|jgi:nucleoside-diphosphate-sugar epimerase|nr:NAD(P)-dependent oxidoreductase [Endomicrobium sp.]